MLSWRVLLVLGAFVSQGHGAEVEYLRAGQPVIDQYFQTTTPGGTDTAIVPNGDVAVIKFPPEVAAMISAHVASARALRYFQEVSLTDFFHGHMISRGPQAEFATPEDYFANLSVILYHSSEYNARWDRDHTVPRSFLGWLDGRAEVEPAIGFAHLSGRKLANYESTGTVYPADLVAGTPSLSQVEWGENEDPVVVPTLNLCQGPQCRSCQIDTQFYILQGPTSGAPLETFFYCLFQPDDGKLSFSFQHRPKTLLSAAGAARL